MEGILLVDKPRGITSHDVVKIIRKKLGVKKVGHAGTLDPMATGLLIIMIGRYTKMSFELISNFKSYEVEIAFFIETETGDITGEKKIFVKSRNFSLQEIKNSLKSFNGISYFQKPPIYSSIKIKGMKLYEYARKNIEVEIPERKIFINKIFLLSYNEEEKIISFFVECSKGTYIRSLASDIAKKLGTVATVTNLRRLNIGNYSINDAKKLAEISEDDIIQIKEYKNENMNKEKTLLMIKPDATKGKFVGSIIKILEEKNFDLLAIKSKNLTREEAEAFYNEHKDRPFFKELIEYICQGLVIAICFQGEDAINRLRKEVGATDPQKADHGTIRKIFGKDINANAVHASDSLISAKREINFFF